MLRHSALYDAWAAIAEAVQRLPEVASPLCVGICLFSLLYNEIITITLFIIY
jgi:hypothetical protein